MKSLAPLLLLAFPATTAFADVQDVVINEIRIDQPGTDNDEYFELAGAPFTDLTGLTYVVLGDTGSNISGIIENATDLSGQSIRASGFFVAAEATFSLGVANLTTDLGFENSDNVTHLLVTGFTGNIGDDIDIDDDGVLEDPPWCAVVDCIALLEEVGGGDLVHCDETVGPDGTFVPAHVYRCNPSGAWSIGSFFDDDGTDTPDAQNLDCAVVINEIRIDQPGSDNDEYFELRGASGTDLTGLTYVVLGDSGDTNISGVIENATDLTGQSIRANGYFVAAEDTFTLGVANLTTTLGFENSDNVTHLLVTNFTGNVGDDIDVDDDGNLENPPWDDVVDCIALLEEVGGGDLVHCEETVGPDGTFVPAHVYRCFDTGEWGIGSFFDADGTDTPKEDNLSCNPPPPTFDDPTPCGQTLAAMTGMEIAFSVVASHEDDMKVVTLEACGVPAGAVLNPALPTSGNPVQSDFSWTPGVPDVGLHTITFIATDDNGGQAFCCVTIEVTSECFLVLGSGPGLTAWTGGSHTYPDLPVEEVIDSYPVLMTDIPSFELPVFDSGLPVDAYTPNAQPGQTPLAPGGARTLTAVQPFRTTPSVVQQYWAQVVMWNPDVFPTNPEQRTDLLGVFVLDNGRVYARNYGGMTGMLIDHEVTTNAQGEPVLRFPFIVPGL